MARSLSAWMSSGTGVNEKGVMSMCGGESGVPRGHHMKASSGSGEWAMVSGMVLVIVRAYCGGS